MISYVKIGDKTVPMVSVASVDRFYKNIFRVDPIALQTGDMDEGEAITLFMQMGFVMAKFAEVKTASGMTFNEDDYLDWLCQFDRKAYYDALPDIRAAYEGQDMSEVDAKKNNDQPSDE